jgi:glycine/D-amino acid oxidase-like deaminating enzyme
VTEGRSQSSAIPFWVDDHPPPADLSSDLPAACDVVVVGSGYTGLSAARRLVRSGRQVVVLEAGSVASGASSVNAGMVSPDVKRGVMSVAREHGMAVAGEIWRATERAVDLVEEIATTEGIDAGWRRVGMAGLTERPDAMPALRTEAAWLESEMGYTTDFVGPDRIGEVVGSDRFAGALVEPAGGGLHPARYAFGLAAAVVRAGAVLCEHTPALEMVTTGSDLLVRTPAGEIRAASVLVATNGLTGDLVRGLRRRVIPVGSYIAVTEPLPGELAERLIPGNRMLWTMQRLLTYFRRTPDDRLLLGGRHDLRTGRDLADSAAKLRRRMIEIFPDLAEVAITHSWGGTIGVTFDLLPHIGRMGDVWYALGYGGHGVALATHLGDEVAGRITGKTGAGPFEALPHPTRWYYRRHPWFLPAAAAWYGVLDRLGR